MSRFPIDRRTVLSAGAASLLTSGLASAQETPRRGGRLTTIANPEPPHLNIGLSQLGPILLIGSKIFQSLLDYDFDLTPRPRLAESWTRSDDGLVYTFKLRKDVTWHDGKPFTSADVVFTCSEFLPKSHSRARVVFSRCRSIEAPDDYTVVFTLNAPFAPFMGAFDTTTSPIIPAHIYRGTDFATNPKNAAPIGTGPFKFKEWVRGQYVHLVRNDAYWRPGRPYIDELYFQIIPDGSSRALALESGQVDLTSSNDLEFVDIARLSAMPGIKVETRGWELFAPHAFMEINNRTKPLDDKRFRQAMMFAIDRNFIKDRIWFGFGKVATGPVGSRTRFYEPNVPRYDYNPDRARALLDEMGLKPDGQGIRTRVSLLQLPYGDTWVRTAEYIRQSLQRVGIRVDMETSDAGGWARREANWEFGITLNFPYQYGDPALGVTRTYITSNIIKGVNFSNTAGYSNPRVDELCERAALALDDKERQSLYSEAQKLIVEDVPIGWLIEISFPTLFHQRVRNPISTAIGVTGDFDDAWLAS